MRVGVLLFEMVVKGNPVFLLPSVPVIASGPDDCQTLEN